MAEWKVVRCSGGAYYETKWVPFTSFKAIRLGTKRFQRCPVHDKWEVTTLVPQRDLTPEIRQQAAAYRDDGVI